MKTFHPVRCLWARNILQFWLSSRQRYLLFWFWVCYILHDLRESAVNISSEVGKQVTYGFRHQIRPSLDCFNGKSFPFPLFFLIPFDFLFQFLIPSMCRTLIPGPCNFDLRGAGTVSWAVVEVKYLIFFLLRIWNDLVCWVCDISLIGLLGVSFFFFGIPAKKISCSLGRGE